ncbi:MAG TPA: crossover junction endodeoxyribonuclease RuvC [Sphingobacteriaceae bacterium]|nr:crossover junction endodeoxyribonuclease RuvC [Sphingobacteriaceae bacterium]
MQKKGQNERIILGIDPGTAIMGYGIILERGRELSLISMGVIKLNHLDDHGLKLQRIFQKTTALIKEYKPDCMALEAPFYGKNIQIMLKLGRAQGVAMAAALDRNLPIFEYAPRRIKQSVTGHGNASKEQVAAMLHTLLKFEEKPEFLDATDGLAVAVCHAFQGGTAGGSVKGKSFSSWSAFVKDQDKSGRVSGL